MEQQPPDTYLPVQMTNLSPEAKKKAELYLFLHRATDEEFTSHWLTLLEDEQTTSQSLHDFVSLWIERDPENALHHLSVSIHQDLYWSILARHFPKKALTLVTPGNSDQLSKVISSIGTGNPDLAISLLNKIPKAYHRFAIGGIIAGLFKDNPANALNFAFEHRLEGYNFHLGQHLEKWAALAPQEAFAWALSHPQTHSDHLARIAPALLDYDPEFFREEFAKFPNGPVKDQLLVAQGAHLAQSNPRDAIDLADQQPPHLQRLILNEIGRSIVHEDPDLALQILTKIITQDSTVSGENPSSTPAPAEPQSIWESTWSKSVLKANPSSVMDFSTRADSQTSSFPANSVSAIKVWLADDSNAARKWLQGQAPSGLRDTLTSHATRHLVQSDPLNFRSHLSLPDQIQSPELRQQTLNLFFDTLAFEYEEGLQQYLKDHQLTPEQQIAYDQRSFN